MSKLFIMKELIQFKEMPFNKSSSLIREVFKLRSEKMLLFRAIFNTCVSEIICYIRYAIDRELVVHNQKE